MSETKEEKQRDRETGRKTWGRHKEAERMGKTVTDRPKTDNQGQIERGRQSQTDRGRETGRETASDRQTDRPS